MVIDQFTFEWHLICTDTCSAEEADCCAQWIFGQRNTAVGHRDQPERVRQQSGGAVGALVEVILD